MCPSSSLLLSSGINIKGPFLFKILFHSPKGIQDGRYEPLNPTANSGEKLNVSAHALMYFYYSDYGFHDVKVNYEDI